MGFVRLAGPWPPQFSGGSVEGSSLALLWLRGHGSFRPGRRPAGCVSGQSRPPLVGFWWSFWASGSVTVGLG